MPVSARELAREAIAARQRAPALEAFRERRITEQLRAVDAGEAKPINPERLLQQIDFEFAIICRNEAYEELQRRVRRLPPSTATQKETL